MARPLLLDLFCGAGGASEGYYRAGFDVVGVDINAQPNYRFEFIQMDALEFLKTWDLNEFDAIHASPPCQAYSTMTKVTRNSHKHPKLIEPVRELLIESGLLYVIENVVGAPLIDPITLCGTSFGKALKRHRLFESNMSLCGLPCRHEKFPKNIRIMNHGWTYTRFVPVYGSGGCKARELWDEVMDIDWMTTKELAESIPPYYTEHIGKQILAAIELDVAA